MSSEYDNNIGINQVPHYERRIGDVIRLGSFMAIELKDQPTKTYTIARFEERIREYDEAEACFETNIRLRLFLPLFPTQRLACHPKPPKHSFSPIQTGHGSENIELYETREVRWIESERPDPNIKVLFPVFVFTTNEMEDPKNAWSKGIHNVFVVRFWHYRSYEWDKTINSLVPLPEGIKLGFVNDHPKHTQGRNMAIPQRCYHSSIWTGLYTLQKSFTKLLNKRGLTSANKEAVSMNIGMIPMETIQYVCMAVNSVKQIRPHPVTLSESYLHLNQSLKRSKFRISFLGGVLRFQSSDDLTILRKIFGPCSTYGSSERRPTLSDGPQGLTLKRGHHLTVVRGKEPSESDDGNSKFKRRCTEQRMDVTFSPYNVRITACYERYVYNLNDDGSLRDPSPCVNLDRILAGKPSGPGKPKDDTSHTDEDSESTASSKEQLLASIRVGDQFLKDGTVWEVIDIARNSSPKKCVCRVIGGELYERTVDKENQEILERDDMVELLHDIHEFA